MILSPIVELGSLGGICLDPTAKKIVEYSVVIEILFEAISFNICGLVVHLDSYLVSSLYRYYLKLSLKKAYPSNIPNLDAQLIQIF